MDPLKNLELAGLCGVLFEQSVDGLILLDLDSDRCLEANRKALRLTGLSREQLRDRTSSEIFIASPASRQRQRWLLQRRDGSHLRIVLRRTHLPAPHSSLVLCQFRLPRRGRRLGNQVDDRVNLDVAVSASDRETRTDLRGSLSRLVVGARSHTVRQQLLASTIDASSDYLAVRALTGAYLAANQAFADFVGLPVVEIVGRSDHELFNMEAASLFADHFDRCVQQNQPLRFKQLVQRGPSASALVEWRIDPVTSLDGTVTMFLLSGRDTGPLPALSDEQIQANKLEALGQITSGVAHDFNNLLTAILGNITLLQSSMPFDHPDAELLTNTEKAAWRAAKLAGQLLEFARKQPQVNELLDLNAVTQEVVSLLQRTVDPKVRITTNLYPYSLPMLGDSGRLYQVLMNLCLNARDAMPQGGLIELTTAPLVRPDSSQPEWVCLRVRDTGTGMSPEVLARVYEPFFTTKPPGHGTGLGLATVHKIVQQLQGTIECSSTLGQGTTFELRFPMMVESCPANTDLPNGMSQSEPLDQALTILLVDDEPFNRTLGKAILERDGYRVVLAEDGQQAVDLFRQDPALLNLVLLDLTMPGLSGGETLQLIRQLDPQIPVLILSGHSSESLTTELLAQVQGFVQKPYRPSDLLAAIRSAITHSRCSA
jgi:two-component system cell cycle sensor histidine kinase/response regulator CckA